MILINSNCYEWTTDAFMQKRKKILKIYSTHYLHDFLEE